MLSDFVVLLTLIGRLVFILFSFQLAKVWLGCQCERCAKKKVQDKDSISDEMDKVHQI